MVFRCHSALFRGQLFWKPFDQKTPSHNLGALFKEKISFGNGAFSSKAFVTPPLLKTLQVRWQHSESQSEEGDESENKTQRKERPEGKRKSEGKNEKTVLNDDEMLRKLAIKLFAKALKAGAGIGSGAALALLYVYNNPPEKWPPFLQRVWKMRKKDELDIRLDEVKKTLQELKTLKECLETLKKPAFLNTDWDEKINNSLQILETNCQAKVQELEADCVKARKIQSANQQTITTLKHDNGKLQAKLNDAQLSSATEVARLKKVVELYRECRSDNDLKDLHHVLQGKSIVDYPKNHRFNKDFFPLLEKALHGAMDASTVSLKFYATYIQEEEGLRYLMNGLAKNTTVQSLDLGNTDITSQHIGALRTMLGANTTLQELSLADNSQLTDDDATSLQDALKANPNRKIKTINLKGTQVTKEKKEAMKTELNITVL